MSELIDINGLKTFKNKIVEIIKALPVSEEKVAETVADAITESSTPAADIDAMFKEEK